MKARELQIGDLLYYKGKFNAFPFKVESITKKKVGYHAEPNEHRMYYLRLSDCEPIPLTPEILENNGFKEGYSYILTADGYKKLPQYKYKNMTQVQDICRNLITISYSDLEGGVYDIQCGIDSHIYDLKYVHQLQHALRLCGIKKEIV